MLLVGQRTRFPSHELSILLPISLTLINRRFMLIWPRFFVALLVYIVPAHTPSALVLLRRVMQFFAVLVHIRMLALVRVFVAPARMLVFQLPFLLSLLSGFAQYVRLIIFMLLVVQHKPVTFRELVTLRPVCLVPTHRRFFFVQPGFSATLFR